MTTTPPFNPDNLERELTDLTTYRGGDRDLWKKALEAPAERAPLLQRPFLATARRHALAACIILVTSVFLIGLFMPALGKARQSARQLKDSTQIRGLHQGFVTAANGHQTADAPTSPRGGPVATRPRGDFNSPPLPAEAPATNWEETRDIADRFVIQKATIEILTPDVRAAFAKAAHLVSEAGSEYVENSSLTGEGRDARANLTLRIGVPRMSEVMNRLRELGKIGSENTTGEDVTTQVVDLEARIRNEQRIEKELLDLLEKRKDAPLKDILELRGTLSSVRQTIEQLTGQRDRMSRLVSLASILVVIRAEPEAPKPPEPPKPAQTIGQYFRLQITETWHDGLRTLTDTIAWLLGLIVSGLMWWMVLAMVILSIQRYRRRLSARCV